MLDNSPRDKSSWERSTFRSKSSGRFVPTGEPKPKRVKVDLPDNILAALDDYARERRIGRGRALTELLPKLLSIPEPPPPPVHIHGKLKDKVRLVQCRLSDPAYKWIRDRHYIPNNGAIGQQVNYLIHFDQDIVGVISGASAVWGTTARDEFFGVSEDEELRSVQLNGIINNNVFRLEHPAPNLASVVLAKWRKQIQEDWFELYGVRVAGFETFIIEENLRDGRCRDGTCYRADNWECVGVTAGNTKKRTGQLDEGLGRQDVVRKLVYCKRIKGVPLPTEYQSSWRDVELKRAQTLKRRKQMPTPLEAMLGRRFE